MIGDSISESQTDGERGSSLKKLKRFFQLAWSGLNGLRIVFFNLLVLVLVVGLLSLWLGDSKPKIPSRAALVLRPVGSIVDQLDGDPQQQAIDQLTGNASGQTLTKDLLDAIEMAVVDGRIEALVLDLNAMGGGGLTKLQQIGRAIQDFRNAGKKVVAVSDGYSDASYYLAAQAEQIYLHPMGSLVLEGYGRFQTYYREGLDRLKVDYNVFRVGEYKSAVEPYLRNDMSPEARQANLEWLGDLWKHYLTDVSACRNLVPEELQAKLNRLPALVEEAEGDIAKLALEHKLVDQLASRDEFRQAMIGLVGENEDTHSFHQIDHSSYLEAQAQDRFGSKSSGDQIAVVVAKGTILDGRQPPGTIGGESTAALIRKARRDEEVKAVVLRVDSGGGSAFASEIIRQELVLTRQAGKKVVVSMGSVAASGGYWISTASDEIWASPTTITGSIGIFAAIPTFHRTLSDHLGIRVDGVGTTPLSGGLRPDRALSPEIGVIIQSSIDKGYRDFLQRVAEAREMTPEEVDKIARGRVWSGEDAHAIGLIDRLGELDQAIGSAAKLAGLETYSVRYIEKELDCSDRVLIDLMKSTATWTASWLPDHSPGPWPNLRAVLEKEWDTLTRFNDPRGIYAYCFCEVE